MYSFYFNEVKQAYELTEMVRMFLPKSEFTILDSDPLKSEAIIEGIIIRIPDSITNKDEGKRYIYDKLKEYTGKTIEWGTLTGVRPVTIVGTLFKAGHDENQVLEVLKNYYYLDEKKAELLLATRKTQQPYLDSLSKGSIAVYVGIPFCPTRCVYCSFPSNQVGYDQIKRYLDTLKNEIVFAGSAAAKAGLYAESIYIGGGTPTVLEDKDLEELLKTVSENFDFSRVLEFTVEAGRPDTITESKLKILKEYGVDRISINPQSMKQETLERIGRHHSPEDIVSAFTIAKRVGFNVINADLIAGLPEETLDDFSHSLRCIMKLEPENITVHTLAVKRSSKLKEIDENYSYKHGMEVRQMLEYGHDILTKGAYKPYYLYRQKQTAGNLENVGYALSGKEGIYNIRIMEENQTVLALGAGGISKVCYPDENRLERVPNVTNFEIYIERIEDMMERKKNGIFNI
ncbi:MAG TPA: coproporphyrinogen dehydrogenase HemZ [Anaerovoracaceae bacterium]|nr:coproporphyrinogen dehydrogenase HemZ [Anaerovoracaceae bacterium]